MASGKRKRGKGKQTKGQYKGSASAHRRARQTLPTYLQGEKDPRPVWSDEPIGYTAPDPDDPGSTATWQHPALAGYQNDDEVPVLVVRPGEEPPPAAGEYIGTVNKTIMMVDRDTGQEIPAPPGSRLYLRTTVPEAGIDTTVRVGSLREVEKIPAKIITSVPEGDTLGLRPGDVIAERQPIGYTDRQGEVVAYADAGIDLPPTGPRGEYPAGSRVWRATAAASGPVTSVDAPGEVFSRHGPAQEDEGGGLVMSAAPRPGMTRAQIDVPLTTGSQAAPGRDEFLRRMEGVSPGLAARLAKGLSPDELTELGPEIARAMEASGADPGSYMFSGGGGGPELVVTDDIANVPRTGNPADEYVIEDLDADDADAGRLLMGNREQVEAYHRRTKAADARARKLIPALADKKALVRSYDAATAVKVRKNWTADEVLDTHAWLTRAYRNPSDDLADYLAFHIRESVAADHHTQSLFWPVDLSEGADIPQGRQMAQIIARGLDDSRTFQVTAPMCHQLRDDWNGRPGELLVLDEGILPVPAGFAWLDAPWLSEQLSEGIWLPVRAVSWERTVATVSSSQGTPYAPPGMSTVDAVRVVLWLLIADDVAFGRWKGAEKRSDKVANKVGRLVPQQIALLPFGVRVNTASRVSTNGKELMGLIHTLWTTLGEKLPKSRQVRASAPAVRQRVQKSIKHGTLQIIPLREYDYVGEPNGHFPQKRDWQCRWWVDEFHRHIDYYDDGADEKGRRRRHQAVPAQRHGTVLDDDHDICAVCLANGQTVRISLVHTFAKGPTSKPFKTPAEAKKRTVWKLKR